MPLAQLGRILRLAFGQLAPPPPASSLAVSDSQLEDGPAAPLSAPERGAYLAWLFDAPALAPRRADPAALLKAIDRELAAKGCCTRFLRRNPAVLPRLIRLLRNERYTNAELAHHIQQDVVLTAEVLRMARSALYAHMCGPELDLPQAVGVLGSAGVEQVMVRVLLWPLYRSDAASLQGRCATRLWEESERCATAGVVIARARGLDPFHAYMAGLLQNSGWSAMLRIVELHGLQGALDREPLADPAFQRELLRRRDQLLSRMVPAWALGPAMDAMARALAAPAPGDAHELVEALRLAHDQVVRRRIDELCEVAEPVLAA